MLIIDSSTRTKTLDFTNRPATLPRVVPPLPELLDQKLDQTAMRRATLRMHQSPKRDGSAPSYCAQMVWHPRLGIILLTELGGQPDDIEGALAHAVTHVRTVTAVLDLYFLSGHPSPHSTVPITAAVILTGLHLDDLDHVDFPNDISFIRQAELPHLRTVLRSLIKHRREKCVNVDVVSVPQMVDEIRHHFDFVERT